MAPVNNMLYTPKKSNIPTAPKKFTFKVNKLESFAFRNAWLIFMLPTMIILGALVIFPLIYSVWLSFHDWSLVKRSITFVGFANYGKALKDLRFWGALGRTGLITLLCLILQFGIGGVMALILSRPDLKGKKFFRIIAFGPALINPIASGFIFRLLFHPESGPINYILSQIAGHKVTIDWVGQSSTALIAVILTDVWQWTPFVAVILMAGLLGTPKEPFEASRVDKATRWQVMRYLTFPIIKPIAIIILMIRTIDLVRMFDFVYALTGGGPGTSTETISFYAYINGYSFFQMGYAAAVSYLLLIILIILITIFIKTAGKAFSKQ